MFIHLRYPIRMSRYSDLNEMKRRAACWTLNRYSIYDSVTEMQSHLGWRALDQRQADARLCMLYKIINGLVAVPLPTYFQRTTSRTRHGLSHPLVIRQIHTSFNFYKYSFFPWLSGNGTDYPLMLYSCLHGLSSVWQSGLSNTKCH